MAVEVYTTRPERVEAMLLSADSIDSAAVWCGGRVDRDDIRDRGVSETSVKLHIPSLDGKVVVAPGCYLIRDDKTGRFATMDKKTFEAKFHKAGTRREYESYNPLAKRSDMGSLDPITGGFRG